MASASRAGLPEVLLQCARLATRQGRWVDAVRDLWGGMAIAREIELPYDEALLLHEYGRMHAAKGELDQARMRLEEALAIFRRLGAAPDVERVEGTLRTLSLAARAKLLPAGTVEMSTRRGGQQEVGRDPSDDEHRDDAG